jgi:hypothetical protein
MFLLLFHTTEFESAHRAKEWLPAAERNITELLIPLHITFVTAVFTGTA